MRRHISLGVFITAGDRLFFSSCDLLWGSMLLTGNSIFSERYTIRVCSSVIQYKCCKVVSNNLRDWNSDSHCVSVACRERSFSRWNLTKPQVSESLCSFSRRKCKAADCILAVSFKPRFMQVSEIRKKVNFTSTGAARPSRRRKKLVKFWFCPSALQSQRQKSLSLNMNAALLCFHSGLSAVTVRPERASVMGSFPPIVHLLDGGADNKLPSGHLRSVISLHLLQPASSRARRCVTDEVWRKRLMWR